MATRDRAGFAEFVAARAAALHRAAYLMVGDVGHAQDLVQEALTKTYVAWPRLRDTSNAEACTRKAGRDRVRGGPADRLSSPGDQPKGSGSGASETALARAAVSPRRWCWRHSTS
ncbi:MAG TPA: sigma factor [Nocardioides sp.]|nr:sigma factor [Nocardioides sp.]